MNAPLAKALERPLKAAHAAQLPHVEVGTWYGGPALLVQGKGFLSVKYNLPDTLVVRCPLAAKETLMDAMPEIYFETDHYKGWPAVLVRLSVIGEAELQQCVVRGWMCAAPKKLASTYTPLVGKRVAKKAAPKKKAAARAKAKRP